MPFINFGTIAAFLVWFGGAGYLLTRYSTLVVSLILILAVVVGILGANIIFWFVVKLLMKHDRELDPAQRASATREIAIDLDPSWSLNHLGVAAFIQDPTSLRIDGASSEYPIARN